MENNLITVPIHCPPSPSYSEMAWHIASLLLSIGHPSRPSDLASLCTFFPASPDFIEFLCFIPNSPIFLTSDSLLILSPAAFRALDRFILAIHHFASTTLTLPPALRFTASSISTWLNGIEYSGICFRKRKRKHNSYGELDRMALLSPKRICNDSSAIIFQSNDNIFESVGRLPINMSLPLSIFVKSLDTPQLTVKKEEVGELHVEIATNRLVPQGEAHEKIIEIEPESDVELVSPSGMLEEAAIKETIRSRTNVDDTFEDFKHSNMSLLVGDNIDGNSVDPNTRISDSEEILECKKTSRLMSSLSMKPVQHMVQPSNTTALEMSPKGDTRKIQNENYSQVGIFKGKQMVADVKNMEISIELPSIQKFPLTPSKLNTMHSDGNAPIRQDLCKISDSSMNIDVHKEKHHNTRDHASSSKGLKKNITSVPIKERKGTSVSMSHEDQKELKELPIFESYIVEEEEGSGGYGIVYKARKKNDGATVAIKCPHAKAHGQHVANELKVLERFGGKNFIIKYEGSFKNGNTDCFVLEHIEHDRPEVLRREIDVLQIQWYGYCLFKALASLHKRGVIHRDVKPGNFLFSRKLNKGYLIDFNLAKDLHQNCRNITSTKSRTPNVNFSETADQRTTKVSKSILDSKDSRRKVMAQPKTKNDRGSGKILKSQGAEGSGVTSAKDVTSTRTSYPEKIRETYPSLRRKQLINCLQETLLGPNQEAQSIPAPMRKRIPAPRGKVESELAYVTPMPLNSTGVDVTGAAFLKNKGNGNLIREGSCVGTKGFRAPEVLFKSPHQGPKLDIWSAGVSLLYLIIGRTPFNGDPEQNIKDIAKLRGSEDLWEVAKLHNREPSFPVELYDKRSLRSIGLRDWCLMNTKRPDFLEVIPGSLFDLLDKCLTVNPRLRISAEEALKHEFFAPCHESRRKQRLCKQELLS